MQQSKMMSTLKTFYQLLIGIFFLAIFARCNESQELGASFFPDESFNIALVDTLSLETASIIYDSIPTRNTGRLLVGYHEDVKLGKIKAASYFQIGFEDNKSYFLNKAHHFYDSITLVLKYDGYSFYDTSQLQTLYVHEVLEDIAIPDEDTTLFNTSTFKVNQTPLGKQTFVPRPGKNGNIEIKLSDYLGQTIYGLAINESELITTATEFQDFLKGFAVFPDTTQSRAILGFSPTAELRLYYRDDSQLPASQKTLAFTLGSNMYFNHIKSDRSNTALATLQEFETPVNSQATDNESFIQTGIGIATRIDIPYVRNMIEVDNDFLVSKAVLQFYPTSNQSNINTPIPSSLTAYWVDEDNEVIGSTFTAYLLSDNEFERDTYYSIDITNFIKTQLSIAENNKNALLLTTTNDFRNALNFISIGNSIHRSKMRLKIYLTSI